MKNNQPHNLSGSALLLTVMIIAILTTTTLSSVAVRFDQLAATDKVSNSAVAKSAADSALVKVKEKIADNQAINPTVFDLDSNTESPISTSSPFRPSPRKIVSTYEKIQTSLPRCSGVIVLAPWTNDGQYLFNQTNDSNPAMIFNYANIVNDTPLGIIPGNGNLGGIGDNAEKQKTISQLTNMGHYYNPFAPIGAQQKDLNYWTVKLGGPQDQFLTRKATDGSSSYYKNVDFVYLPYLPRWSDSGIFTTTSGTKLDRISAIDLQTKFETTIKENNFKVWIDASISDTQLYQYGFGDLFVNSPDYRLKWLQPSLWNDTPEADLMTPYVSSDAENPTLSWTKKPEQLKAEDDNGWKVAIVKGAKSFSFVKLANKNQSFTPGAPITGLIYGSLEGLRLNQAITLLLLDKNQQPIELQNRRQDQGRLQEVKLTKIGPLTNSNGVQSISVEFKLGSTMTTYIKNTPPKLADGQPVTGSELDTIVVLAPPQYSTANSIESADINAPAVVDGESKTKIIVNASPKCQVACPAIGDLVSLTKANKSPVWGRVTDVSYPSGSTMVSFSVDKLRQSPLPSREMAYTYFEKNGPKIAYYGGSVVMNDYDGGYASESDQLWIYDPVADSWEFKSGKETTPGRRAGASMVYDSDNDRLVMIGGYYHEAVDSSGKNSCQDYQLTCLYTNQPGLRIAKRVTNDVYTYDFNKDKWEKIDYTFDQSKKIQSGANYTVRLTSTLADRSGLGQWLWTAKSASGEQIINFSESSMITLNPSAAGVAKGDEIYFHGIKKSDDSNFYAWGRVTSVNYSTGSVGILTTGYKIDTGADIVLRGLKIQVIKRRVTTNTCAGGYDVSSSNYYCTFNSGDTTGYAVGDSVVLEQYDATNILNTLSGFISYIDPVAGKAYFVADERSVTAAVLKDYSAKSAGIIADESAVAFPSARYGATFALQPTSSTQAAYWQGATQNNSYSHRFADLWNIQFFKNKSGAGSAVWSFQPTDNTIDPSFTTTSIYNFQVIQPNYSYQIATTNDSTNAVEKDLEHRTSPGTKIWNDNRRWSLEIDPADAEKVVVGAWATLERRLNNDGTRETFHGIVENTYINQPAGCVSYAPGKLCLRHNPAYPSDSGFALDSKNVKVTMTPSFNTSEISGGTFKGFIDHIALQSVPIEKLATIPAVGAMVMIWKQGNTFPLNAYTFTIKSRSYNNGKFNFYFDRLTASPPPIGFSTSQIVSDGTTNRLVTIGDHQLAYPSDPHAPEWIKDISTGAWKIRLANKSSTVPDRPASRRAGMVANIYDSSSKSSKLFMAGGTFGQYGTLWKQENAGLTIGDGLKWSPQYVSAGTSEDIQDIPNLFGGSLVVYKSDSTIKAVYFGGKQKTDNSTADYGRSVGAKMLGRPDTGTGTQSDNSFYITDNFGSNDSTAVSFAKTIEDNKSVSWPTGSIVDNSLILKGGDRGTNTVCAYLAQIGCLSKSLLSQLGDLGRLDDSSSNDSYNGWTWGKSAVLSQLGDRFKSQSSKASLIMSASTMSGSGVNGRWEQDGYQPYLADTSLAYGKLASNFTSDKTTGLVAYSQINNATDKGGSVLVTSVGVGTAIASNRGGVTGTKDGWYSYCAASEIKKDAGAPILNDDNLYQCKADASRYLPTLPDAEDLLFMLNATQAISSVDTYKVVGYYGGVKRGYLVTAVDGTLPKVYEIVP